MPSRSIRLPDELDTRIVEMAARENRSWSDVLRRMLESALESPTSTRRGSSAPGSSQAPVEREPREAKGTPGTEQAAPVPVARSRAVRAAAPSRQARLKGCIEH